MTAPDTQTDHAAEDRALLPEVVRVVQAAGAQLLARFSGGSRVSGRDELLAALQANDAASLAVLRPALTALRPQTKWVADEMETGALPAGEWWVVDPVEGNINHIHGLPEWCVSATLVREGAPALTAVFFPLTGETYSAARGAGAQLNGTPLSTSGKTDFGIALVSTGQAEPHEPPETRRRLGESMTAMTGDWRVLRASVPTTLHLVQVAAGHTDVFWEYSRVRSGLMAGALLVTEAGGAVSDTRGAAWSPERPDFLAAAPGVHAQAVQALSTVR